MKIKFSPVTPVSLFIYLYSSLIVIIKKIKNIKSKDIFEVRKNIGTKAKKFT